MIGAVWREPDRARRRAANRIPAAATGSKTASQNHVARSRRRWFCSGPLAVTRKWECTFSPRIVVPAPTPVVRPRARSPVDRMFVDVALVPAAVAPRWIRASAGCPTYECIARAPRERTAGEPTLRGDPAARPDCNSAFEPAAPEAVRALTRGGDPTTTGGVAVVGPLAGGADAFTAGGGTAAGGGAGAAGAGGVALGATGGADKGGRNRSGSTYPFGSSERRTPRWTYGTSCSTSPLGPIVPTASPSATFAVRRTLIEPRWVSVTE
jgi:hypothetical protein